MNELIEALNIFLKYDNPFSPTHCEHDELWICGNYDPKNMTEEDVKRLDELGFFWDDDMEGFKSFRFGSA